MRRSAGTLLQRLARQLGSQCSRPSPSCRHPLSTIGARCAPDENTTPVPLRSHKTKKEWDGPTSALKRHGAHFVDWKRVRVKAGDGGDGSYSMAHLFQVEYGGPDGGDGGNGGHVIFRAEENVNNSLSHVSSAVSAPNGTTGKGSKCDGKNGQHQIVAVPPGTVLRNLEGDIVAELEEVGSMFIAARGGAGGKGNTAFKSSTNQAPQISEAGGEGECFTFDVELRTLAEVGLIGFPNAGKSTLLRSISRARPKVAAYPFTTLNPYVGMVFYDDYETVSVADIPGLIKDAHKNKGLGISFLRHVERCTCLVFVIDLSQPDPMEQFETLKFELEQYQTGLSEKPHALLANKMDLDEAKENANAFKEYVASLGIKDVFFVSGKTGANLRDVLTFIRQLKDRNKTATNDVNTCQGE